MKIRSSSTLLAACLCTLFSVTALAQATTATGTPPLKGATPTDTWDQEPMIGMYVHQHWSYNHPYAARTWTYDDWTGYMDGLKKIGFNTVLIWPVLETMPNPLTQSDRENLEKLRKVIDFAHDKLDMRVLITLCPNVIAKNEEARKYKFVERPFFYTDLRVNPGDAVEMGKMMAFREEIFQPLKKADGVLIIDSDPGGYPGSDNLEFANLLNMHGTMLHKLNPKMELYYWIHAGWEAYCRFYETAEFAMGTDEEVREAIALLAKVNPEPWGLASGRGPDIANELGQKGRVMSYQYGGIEGEPSFPLTNFLTERAYVTATQRGVRGVMGNAQTHAVQLPNTFMFARGATGQPNPTMADYTAFAERLLPGHGEAIVRGWEAINSIDAPFVRAALDALRPMLAEDLKTGDLKGLLFGDAKRFVNDLIMMLESRATLEELHLAVQAGLEKPELGLKLQAFVTAVSTWQKAHDYKNNWVWARMEEPLMKIDPATYGPFFQQRSYKGEGNTPFEQVVNGYKTVETFTPRLLEAMQKSATQLQQN